MKNPNLSSLARSIHLMPDFVKNALTLNGLFDAYQSRPPYQQNDYIGWINRAKKQETREKRLRQMLAELDDGRLYMKMKYNPK